MSEVKQVPKLRFLEFSSELKKVILNDIATFSKGKNISKSDIVEDGKIECIRYGELYTVYNEIITEIVSKTNLPKDTLIYSKSNDVIIPSSGETQLDIATASCVLKDDIALGGDLNIIRTEENGVFISFYLNSAKKKRIASLAQGNSVVHLYNNQLKTLRLNLPELKEQQKIATFLTAVDKKISQLQQKKSLLEQYKKGVMQQIFNQELRFRDDDGKEFPDWEEKRLGDIAKVVMGQSPNSSSYNTNSVGTYLIQGNADIKERLTSPRNWTSEPTKLCDIGDLILTVRAPVGAIAKSKHNGCIGRGVCSIKNNSNSDIEFLYQFLLDYEDKWVRLEQGSTFTAVSGKDINSIKIALPSKEEQTKIANFLSSIDAKIGLVATQLENTQQFKKGLLQQMFV